MTATIVDFPGSALLPSLTGGQPGRGVTPELAALDGELKAIDAKIKVLRIRHGALLRRYRRCFTAAMAAGIVASGALPVGRDQERG